MSNSKSVYGNAPSSDELREASRKFSHELFHGGHVDHVMVEVDRGTVITANGVERLTTMQIMTADEAAAHEAETIAASPPLRSKYSHGRVRIG